MADYANIAESAPGFLDSLMNIYLKGKVWKQPPNTINIPKYQLFAYQAQQQQFQLYLQKETLHLQAKYEIIPFRLLQGILKRFIELSDLDDHGTNTEAPGTCSTTRSNVSNTEALSELRIAPESEGFFMKFMSLFKRGPKQEDLEAQPVAHTTDTIKLKGGAIEDVVFVFNFRVSSTNSFAALVV